VNVLAIIGSTSDESRGLGLAGYNLCIGGISLKLGSVAAVGLRGGLGGHFLCTAIEDEAVDTGERVQLRFGCGVGARRVHNGRGSAHLVRVRSSMYSSRLRRRIRTALPTFAALMWPSRISFHSVERPRPEYLSASGYRSHSGWTCWAVAAYIIRTSLRLCSYACIVRTTMAFTVNYGKVCTYEGAKSETQG
jgi:hypothetical protein